MQYQIINVIIIILNIIIIIKITQQIQQMPGMGKTEEDWNGLKLGFLKTVHVCNFKNNAQETY